MVETPHKYEVGQRVRLKGNGQDRLYPAACAYSEGWVRKLDHDRFGFPMVFIEWDEDHWTYNGENNQWTFEDHFEPVEEDMAEKKEEQADALRAFAKAFGIDLDGDSEEVTEEEKTPVRIDIEEGGYPSQEHYLKTLDAAIQQARQAQGFLLITLAQQQHPELNVPVMIPTVINSYQSAEVAILLESQLPKIAAMAHAELAQRVLMDIHDQDS